MNELLKPQTQILITSLIYFFMEILECKNLFQETFLGLISNNQKSIGKLSSYTEYNNNTNLNDTEDLSSFT